MKGDPANSPSADRYGNYYFTIKSPGPDGTTLVENRFLKDGTKTVACLTQFAQTRKECRENTSNCHPDGWIHAAQLTFEARDAAFTFIVEWTKDMSDGTKPDPNPMTLTLTDTFTHKEVF